MIVSQTAITIISGYAIFDTTADTAPNNLPNADSLVPISAKNLPIPPDHSNTATAPAFIIPTNFAIGPLVSVITSKPSTIGVMKFVTAVLIEVIILPIADPSPRIPLKHSIAPLKTLAILPARLLNTLRTAPTAFLNMFFIFSTSSTNVTSILNRIFLRRNRESQKSYAKQVKTKKATQQEKDTHEELKREEGELERLLKARRDSRDAVYRKIGDEEELKRREEEISNDLRLS